MQKIVVPGRRSESLGNAGRPSGRCGTNARRWRCGRRLDRLYPYAPYPPSWTEDDKIREYGAPVNALTLNDNTITISILPGAEAGRSGANLPFPR